jgi:hypothetical protein
MAVIYKDETTKYKLNWNVYEELGETGGILSSWFGSFFKALNTPMDLAMNWLEGVTDKSDELEYYKSSDKNLYESEENRMRTIAIVFVVLMALVYMIMRKK